MTPTIAIPPDLQPTNLEERKWSWAHYSSLWMGSVHNIPSYAAIAGFFALGLSVYEVIGVILVSAICIAFLMTINGVAGEKYGIPHPVLLQWIYGKNGAKIPGVLRGLLAGIMWFGLQTYAGSTALFLFIQSMFPSFSSLGPEITLLGLSPSEAFCFLAFLFITLIIGWGGTRFIGPLTKLTSLFIILIFSYLGGWSFVQAGGWNSIFVFTDSPMTSPLLLITCVSALTATWIAPIVSSSDMTRYAKTPQASVIGQWIGLLVTYMLFIFTSVSIIKGMEIQFGLSLVNIVDMLPFIESPIVRYLALITIVLATLSVNTLGNMIPAANQLTALFPKILQFRSSLIVLAVLSTLFMPWRLLESSTYLLFFLSLLGAMLAPVIGVMLSHFYLIRKQQLHFIKYGNQIFLPTPNDFQVKAAVTVSLSVGVICIMGNYFSIIHFLYDISVFAGLLLSSFLYTLLIRLEGKRHLIPFSRKRVNQKDFSK